MALNYTPTTLGTLNNNSILSQSNLNFTNIATTLQDGLSRSGNGPNQMLSSLDMNNEQIINLPPPATSNSAARLADVQAAINNTTFTLPSNIAYTNTPQVWSAAQTFNGGATIPYQPTGSAISTTINAHLNAASFVSVLEFGAVGDGVHDDTSAIQACINAASLSNGTVLFPSTSGEYIITSPLFLGNGSSSTGASTQAGVTLQGGGNTSAFQAPAIKYTGASTALAMVNVLGPVTHCNITGIFFDANSLAANCVALVAAQLCSVSYCSFFNATTGAIQLRSLPSSPSGNINCQFNNINNIEIALPNISTAIGVQLIGNGVAEVSNCSFNSFENILIVFPNTTTSFSGFYLQDCDSNQFKNLSMFNGGSGTVCFNFDYTGTSAGGWPSNNTFIGFDPDGGLSGVVTAYNNIGTPAVNAKPNRFWSVYDTNSGIYPKIANTIYLPEIINPGVTALSQTANIGLTNLTPQPLFQNALWRVSWYLEVITAGTGGTIALSFGWTDSAQAESFTSPSLNLNSKGYISGTNIMRALGTTNIQYSTLLSSPTGSPVYNLHIRLEKLD